MTKPACHTVIPWLKANLGKSCIAPLTSTDAKALAAAVQIVELYAYHSGEGLLVAFNEVVQCMQPQTRELAYHAIAHIRNWEDRRQMWADAKLPMDFSPRKCTWEPGGSGRSEVLA